MKLHHEVNKLEEQKKEIISFMNDIDEQLRARKIRKREHAKIIEAKYEGKHKEQLITEIDDMIRGLHDNYHSRQKKKLKYAAGAAAIFLMLMLAMFSGNNLFSPTGFAVGPRQATGIINYNAVFEQNTEAALGLDKITSLRISGMLEGTGATVKLRVDGVDYLVARITTITQDSLITGMAIGEEPSPYAITTDKTEYGLGEMVAITITPEADDKSLYVYYNDEMRKLDDGASTYLPAEAGEYKAIALIVLPEDIIRVEAGFLVTEAAAQKPAAEEQIEEPIIEPEQLPSGQEQETATGYDFSNLCTDSCSLDEISNPTLVVELDSGSKLTITELIITRNKENSAPEQSKLVPNLALLTGQEATLELEDYFTDPDEDSLEYDINDIPEINSAVSQSGLTISSDNPGVYTAYIYATDGDALVTSNTFTITITEGEPVGDKQSSNETGNETIPEAVVPIAEADPCADPNPNKRPAYCIEGREVDYFKNAAIHLQNLDRRSVARVTAFGNLMIKGQLVENSEAIPGNRDFKISYSPNGEMNIVTAWIDSETGDLHLKGSLHEEEFILLPASQNSFLIQNKKGTNLGYFDTTTGDLYLRGNLIRGREEADLTES